MPRTCWASCQKFQTLPSSWSPNGIRSFDCAMARACALNAGKRGSASSTDSDFWFSARTQDIASGLSTFSSQR